MPDDAPRPLDLYCQQVGQLKAAAICARLYRNRQADGCGWWN